jgi:transcriptional regulator with XRE-family HTH domain
MTRSNQNASSGAANDRRGLGARLRQAREYLGFSQEDVATFLGIARSALSNIETGQRRLEALELQKLAKLFNLPVSHFTSGDETDLPITADVAHLARKAAALSEQDRQELSRFADYLRSRKQEKGG